MVLKAICYTNIFLSKILDNMINIKLFISLKKKILS